MRGKYRPHHILEVVLLFIALAGFSTSNSKANENSKYLDAVREFADNVLKYGRDTYGPKHTPLFVDGLNIHTHEPVKWITPNGDRWIISNLTNQQTLMRTFDGLTRITGDPKYKQAAMDAIKYAFENLCHPYGLLYWGHVVAYDAKTDNICGVENKHHCFKLDYPYYELMWEVNPESTQRFIEAFWSAHITDWSNLDMDRIGYFDDASEEPWNHEYEGGPTFFKGKRGGVANSLTGSSLVQAGTTLYRLTDREPPLVWSKRLAKRFVDTRHPKTGISALVYNTTWYTFEDMKEHFVDPYTTVFPYCPFEYRYLYYPESVGEVLTTFPWMSMFLVGEMLVDKGKEFTQWALEEFTAWGKVSYRKKDNSFVPLLTDGTNLEGYVWKKWATGLNVAKPCPAGPSFFWTYSVAYSATGDEFMWQMVRDIALGNGLGDIGKIPAHTPQLETDTTCSNVYSLFGFLELHKKTSNPYFLKMAQHIGDNIVDNQFYKGFFVPSRRHIYTRFDCFEPLALLRLDAAMKSQIRSVPRPWPSVPLFVCGYRHKQEGVDRRVIYDLIESPELPLSLQEAAAMGDIDLVRSLLDKGIGVDSWDDSLKKTALQHAAMKGHKEVVELLLDKGARIDAQEDFPGGSALDYAAENGHRDVAELLIARGADVNAKRGYPAGDRPLHSAVRAGHKDIVELLISKGADVNAKDTRVRTPIDLAMNQGRKEIAKLLLSKSGDVSLHTAAYLGDLQRVEKFIEDVADVDAKDQKDQTALHYAAKTGQIAVAKLLIANGADVNAGEWTPLQEAAYYSKEMVELLLAKGANINTGKWTALHSALDAERFDIVELLLAKGADANIRDGKGRTPLHIAAWYAASKNPKIVELLLSKGADIKAKDNNGKTALSSAMENGHTEIVEMLRKHGAKE